MIDIKTEDMTYIDLLKLSLDSNVFSKKSEAMVRKFIYAIDNFVLSLNNNVPISECAEQFLMDSKYQEYLKDEDRIENISEFINVISDWEEDNISEGDETILIFLPKDENSGIVLRNKGYTESFISSSNYFVDEQNNLHIKTIYKSTVSEERISFLSTHIRSRFSTIRNQETKSVIQTSHTSEIRNLANLKD